MLEHIVRFEQGHDCIEFECIYDSESCKPGSGGSHGRSGMRIRFVSKGEEGAVQFVLGTGLTPQFVEKSNIGYRQCGWSSNMVPFDLGYHSKTPMYDDHDSIVESCEFCDGQPCYYDGSGLNANDAMYALVNGGDEALWSFLDAYYNSVFFGGEYPQPAEYQKKPRQENRNEW